MTGRRAGFVLLLVTQFMFVATAAAGLPDNDASGWHSWRVGTTPATDRVLWVRLEHGRPLEIHSTNYKCHKPHDGEVIDLGVVTPQANFRWFKAFAEDPQLSPDLRAAALFGLAQSDSHEAYAYLDAIINL